MYLSISEIFIFVLYEFECANRKEKFITDIELRLLSWAYKERHEVED